MTGTQNEDEEEKRVDLWMMDEDEAAKRDIEELQRLQEDQLRSALEQSLAQVNAQPSTESHIISTPRKPGQHVAERLG
eukprot:1133341-Pyramimonas_sp.AAC.1